MLVEPSRPLPFSVRVGWALGQLPIACHVGVVSFYLQYFVTDGQHISPAWAGLGLLLPRIFNIIFDPVMGSVSDRSDTRFGRRRPFLLGGSILWGLAIMALFGLPIGADKASGAAWLFVAFMAVSIGQTLYHVPYSAMLAEMTSSTRERINLSSLKEAVSRVGVLLAAATVPIVVAFFPSQVVGFRVAGIIFGAIIAAGGIIAFYATARTPTTPASETQIPVAQQIRALVENRPLRLLVSAYALIMIADEVFSGSLIYYAVNVLNQTPAFVGMAYPISSVAAILSIPLWNMLAFKMGRRSALVAAVVGMAASWLAVLAIPVTAPWLILPLMAVGGIFNAGLLMIPNAMVPDTVDHDAIRTGQRREGSIYGAWIFCQQTAMALGGFLISAGLTLISYRTDGGPQPLSVHEGLGILIAVVPAACLLAVLPIIRIYPLANQRQDR